MASNKYGEIPENEDELASKVRKLDIYWHFRSPYLWGILIASICALVFFLYPTVNKSHNSWSPGPLHSGHSMLANNCEACHSTSFKSIDDASCNACHQMGEHGSETNKVNFAHNSDRVGLKHCADCHVEHKEVTAFMPTESKLCVQCHANLASIVTSPINDSFASFHAHSEFMLMQGTTRVKISDKVAAKDPTPLKFNHEIHLKPDLKGSNGKVTMACDDCHKFSHDGVQTGKINFETNCRSCHPLSFDDRIPKSVVPHGDAEAVFQFLLGEYSKFLGVDLPKKSESDSVRRIPGKPDAKNPERPVLLASVIKEARASEDLLFAKTSCQLCHIITKKDNSDPWASNYDVKKPQIPEKWLAKANFNHGAHEIASCESCHIDTRKSKETSDVLIPGIETCRSCHVDEGHKGLVPSNCSGCHAYHGSQPLKADRKKEIEELLRTFK